MQMYIARLLHFYTLLPFPYFYFFLNLTFFHIFSETWSMRGTGIHGIMLLQRMKYWRSVLPSAAILDFETEWSCRRKIDGWRTALSPIHFIPWGSWGNIRYTDTNTLHTQAHEKSIKKYEYTFSRSLSLSLNVIMINILCPRSLETDHPTWRENLHNYEYSGEPSTLVAHIRRDSVHTWPIIQWLSASFIPSDPLFIVLVITLFFLLFIQRNI